MMEELYEFYCRVLQKKNVMNIYFHVLFSEVEGKERKPQDNLTSKLGTF